MDKIQTMPKVNDRLMRIMTTAADEIDEVLRPCTVIFVNEPHQFYTVRFDDSGVIESYKFPDIIDEDDNKDKPISKKSPCRRVCIIELDAFYPSVKACAKALGVAACTVSAHLTGRTRMVKGYHIRYCD